RLRPPRAPDPPRRRLTARHARHRGPAHGGRGHHPPGHLPRAGSRRGARILPASPRADRAARVHRDEAAFPPEARGGRRHGSAVVPGASRGAPRGRARRYAPLLEAMSRLTRSRRYALLVAVGVGLTAAPAALAGLRISKIDLGDYPFVQVTVVAPSVS